MALTTAFTGLLDRWRGREAELAADDEAQECHAAEVSRGALPALPVWAGEGVDLVTALHPAADLVPAMAAEAEEA